MRAFTPLHPTRSPGQGLQTEAVVEMGLKCVFKYLEVPTGKRKVPGVPRRWCFIAGWRAALKCGVGKRLGSCPFLGRAEWVYGCMGRGRKTKTKTPPKMQDAAFRLIFRRASSQKKLKRCEGYFRCCDAAMKQQNVD